MTKNTWIKTILGIILSLSIAFYVNQFLHSIREEVEVVVAAKDIMPETVITKDMVKKIRVNKADQSILVPDALKREEEVIGAVAVKKIRAGEVIINDPDKIVNNIDQAQTINLQSEDKDKVRKAFFIPTGMRAITVSVDAEGGLAFTLQKGDKVDVIFTSSKGETGGIYSSIILKNIEVFDVQGISAEDRQTSTSVQHITLLVIPKQAQNLALAKRKGKIDLALNPININRLTPMPTGPTYPYEFTYQKGVN
ncbi:Flp pilus assembly protein CpaB [Vulcanibacillus modesticaldus]|uniref:Flp pilus assembly protein CpaB n=1 Tax=Vulcanibacillus modesticaldus TaxID=337097 RepID=A0A1D2YTW1_9BACI|nr:Flp pilus assembly protein CpaB [Vulcanibacillus modesticaldus]OEF99142.1 Flp pilus assembly protein CpaB [Vulcanibacillus modesticaldus]